MWADAAAAASVACSSEALLPKPTGLFQVGRSVTEVIDNSRIQPFAPDEEPVKLEISIFYPVIAQAPLTSGAYMPPETARVEDLEYSSLGFATPNGTFKKLALNLADNQATSNLNHDSPFDSPLVLFMPALGTTRLLYSQIASTIASQGYTVVTIDSAYDVDIVEFSDGSVTMFNATLEEFTNLTAIAQGAYLAIQTRVDDVSFVLDSLSNATLAHSLVPNLPQSGLNTTHTAMFGHSLGGATAFSILEMDDRVLGGLNMDGALLGPGLQNGTNKPFMLVGHANHTRDQQADDPFLTWEHVWPLLTGWKRDIFVAETEHYDFSDAPVVLEALGITPGDQTALPLGSMEGNRALQIVTTYVGAFLDYVIYGKCSALLEGPVESFPEVTFEY